MKLIYGIGKVKQRFRRPVVSVGIFDGLHLGHRHIINQLIKQARKIDGRSIVITFYPHPEHILKPESSVNFLIPLKQRLELFSQLGVDVCIVIKFTKSFSKLRPQDFVEKVLVNKIGVHELIVGEDFNFGNKREGNIKSLGKLAKIYGFRVRESPALKSKNKKISSTLIRSLIKKGDLEGARRFLGRNISITGEVIKGAKRGVKLGCPTANIKLIYGVIPANGVYAAKINLGKKVFYGMANVGMRPTFAKKRKRLSPVIEVNIFNFRKKIYGRQIQIEFLKRIRQEKKFSSKERLIRQIQIDRIKIKKLFSYLKNPT